MKKEPYQKWLERVEYDIDTAGAMYKTRRYIYAVFMCQQALEKCFKAMMSYKGMEVIPVHNLRRLAEKIDIIQEMTSEELRKMDFLSQYYLNARYKEDIEELSKHINKSTSENYIKFSREKIKWLSLKMKP